MIALQKVIIASIEAIPDQSEHVDPYSHQSNYANVLILQGETFSWSLMGIKVVSFSV